jgi:Fe2+ transport system protein B
MQVGGFLSRLFQVRLSSIQLIRSFVSFPRSFASWIHFPLHHSFFSLIGQQLKQVLLPLSFQQLASCCFCYSDPCQHFAL